MIGLAQLARPTLRHGRPRGRDAWSEDPEVPFWEISRKKRRLRSSWRQRSRTFLSRQIPTTPPDGLQGKFVLPRQPILFRVPPAHDADFEAALAANRRKYPIPEFRLFTEAVRNYAEKTRNDDMIHRAVVGAVNGLVDALTVERKRVPSEVLFEADRLECFVFLGYDPNFAGDEPPDL